MNSKSLLGREGCVSYLKISIHMLQEVDAQDLFKFELENRRFFEKMVPNRGNDYFVWDTFVQRHAELLKEQEHGISNLYLIKNNDGKIVGRINLVDLDKKTSTAELGFRVGEPFVGKGIGNKALSQLLNTDLEIKRINAKTTTVNKASQKVLEYNGFVQTAMDNEEFEMNGQKMKFIHYLWEKKNSTSKKHTTTI